MFEVLVYVYENYWRGDACPDAQHLERKLSSVGFESEDILQALDWLDGLRLASQEIKWHADDATTAPSHAPLLPAATSMRIYTAAELDHLGSEALGFITFLADSNVLPPPCANW